MRAEGQQTNFAIWRLFFIPFVSVHVETVTERAGRRRDPERSEQPPRRVVTCKVAVSDGECAQLNSGHPGIRHLTTAGELTVNAALIVR